MPKVRRIFILEEQVMKKLDDLSEGTSKSKYIEWLIKKEYTRMTRLKSRKV